MTAIQFTARRAVFAVAIAIATIGVPAVAAIASSPATVAPRILAQCSTSSEPGNAELDCEPPSVDEFSGAPSEMELTDTNPGVGSPHGR